MCEYFLVAQRVICLCSNRVAIQWFNLCLLIDGILIFSLQGGIKLQIKFLATVHVPTVHGVQQAQHLQRLLRPVFLSLLSLAQSALHPSDCLFRVRECLLPLCYLSLHLLSFLPACFFQVLSFDSLCSFSLSGNKLTGCCKDFLTSL